MVLLVLGWAGALQVAAFVPESFLFSHPDHKLQDYIAGPITAVLINAGLCILLIQEYGILGAAAAAIVARFVLVPFCFTPRSGWATGQQILCSIWLWDDVIDNQILVHGWN